MFSPFLEIRILIHTPGKHNNKYRTGDVKFNGYEALMKEALSVMYQVLI